MIAKKTRLKAITRHVKRGKREWFSDSNGSWKTEGQIQKIQIQLAVLEVRTKKKVGDSHVFSLEN